MIIIGAGAQTKYVLEVLLEGQETIEKILDPIGGMVGRNIRGFEIQKFDETLCYFLVVICVSDSNLKQELYYTLKKTGNVFPKIVHKKSVVSEVVKVGIGSILNAGCVLQPYSTVGMFSMIHANVLIEHDCEVGSFCNLGPSSVLCGHVKIGEHSTIGPGSVITKKVSIGKNSIIGAGSVVLDDIPDNVVAYGNPCKVIKKHINGH